VPAALARRVGWVGSHHIFAHAKCPAQLNLQEVNGEAKPYQIRQFLGLVTRYNLERKTDR
jgi:hypothetical protein